MVKSASQTRREKIQAPPTADTPSKKKVLKKRKSVEYVVSASQGEAQAIARATELALKEGKRVSPKGKHTAVPYHSGIGYMKVTLYLKR